MPARGLWLSLRSIAHGHQASATSARARACRRQCCASRGAAADRAAELAGKVEALTSSIPGFAAQIAKALPGQLPSSFDPGNNYYLWYNCTMAMFQVGGEPWKRWNAAVRDRVIALQLQGDGCDRGSWPPNDLYSVKGGRIYSTALAVLTLEVYYRFQRVAGQPKKEKFLEK